MLIDLLLSPYPLRSSIVLLCLSSLFDLSGNYTSPPLAPPVQTLYNISAVLDIFLYLCSPIPLRGNFTLGLVIRAEVNYWTRARFKGLMFECHSF